MESQRFFDWVVEGPDPLPDLCGELAWGSADVVLHLGGKGAPPDPGGAWSAVTRKEDGTPALECLRAGDVHWLRFPGLALFSLGPEEGMLRGHPLRGVPAETVRHLAVDAVLPGLRCRRGRPVLRAAAVLGEGGALLFVGPEGSGKSSLAAGLARRGLPLVGDDMIALEGTGEVSRAAGTLTGIRLWPGAPPLAGIDAAATGAVASHTRKVRVDPPAAGIRRTGDPVAVRRVHLLPARGGAGTREVRIEPLSAREAAAALADAAFLLDPAEAAPLRERFLRAPLVPLLPLARRLAFPFGGQRFEAVLDAVLAEARGN